MSNDLKFHNFCNRPSLFSNLSPYSIIFRDIEPLIFSYFEITDNISPNNLISIIKGYKKLSFMNYDWYLYVTNFILKNFYDFFGRYHDKSYQDKILLAIDMKNAPLIKYFEN